MFATTELFWGKAMRHTYFAAAALSIAIATVAAGSAAAQDTSKIGLVFPMTGTVGAPGQGVAAPIKLYVAHHGDMVPGKNIQLTIRDSHTPPHHPTRLTHHL